MAKKILLADDSITIQKVISITFASESYDLTIVGDGDAAIRKAKELNPDLVMADVAMPGKTGYEVCETIKKDPAFKNTPVLLLAGTFEPLNRDEALRVGADDSIIKPFESQELTEKVRELLGKAEARLTIEQAPPPVAAKAQAQSAPSAPEDIWQASDFLGFTEETEKNEFKSDAAPDLDFLDGGLFEEPQKDLSSSDFSIPHEKDFLDLEFRDDEIKSAEPVEVKENKDDAFGADFEPFKAGPFEVEPFDIESFAEPKKTEAKPEPVKQNIDVSTDFSRPDFDFSSFDAGQTSSFESIDDFEPAPAEAAKPFWAENLKQDEAEQGGLAEPELIEVNEDAVAEETPQPGPFFEEPVFNEPVKPFIPERPISKAEPTVRLEAVQPLEVAPPAPKAAPLSPALERSVEKVETKAKEAIGDKFEGLGIPREQVEAIVARVAREVIEEIAWEVIPELAEELIKAEISKAKEAILKLK